MATKTPTEGPSPFTGFTIYRVTTVLVNNSDLDAGKLDEHFEVCDDANGLPIASDLIEGAAVSKAKAILKIRSDVPGAEQSSNRKKLRVTKTESTKKDPSIPVGCSLYQVKTVELDDQDQETGRVFAEYHEVCDDNMGLPVAAHADMDQAIANAITVLETEILRKTLNEDSSSGITPPKIVI